MTDGMDASDGVIVVRVLPREPEPLCDARLPDRCRVARIATATETPLLFHRCRSELG
jgi:hypothetical protein